MCNGQQPQNSAAVHLDGGRYGLVAITLNAGKLVSTVTQQKRTAGRRKTSATVDVTSLSCSNMQVNVDGAG